MTIFLFGVGSKNVQYHESYLRILFVAGLGHLEVWKKGGELVDRKEKEAN